MENLMSDKKLENLLKKLPGDRVTTEYMKSCIRDVGFVRIGEKVTVCCIELDNGYCVLGQSACVSPENYNQEIGEKIAYDNAFDKLWPLFGFLLAERKKESN